MTVDRGLNHSVLQSYFCIADHIMRVIPCFKFRLISIRTFLPGNKIVGLHCVTCGIRSNSINTTDDSRSIFILDPDCSLCRYSIEMHIIAIGVCCFAILSSNVRALKEYQLYVFRLHLLNFVENSFLF